MAVTMLAASHWDRNTQADTAARLERPDSAIVQQLDPGHEPPSFPIARVGFQGLRANLDRIVSTIMPGIPGGPPKIIAARDEAIRGGQAAVTKIKAAAQYTPVMSVEQTAPYWEYLQS